MVFAGLTQNKSAILVPKLPAYTLGDLAAAMEMNLQFPNGLGQGEKVHESMISADEAPEFYDLPDMYIRPGSDTPADAFEGCYRAMGALTSNQVARLTVEEIRQRLKEIP